MPDADDIVIGLFPLRLVLLPGEILPLHVFEERYKRLVGECRRDEEVFGLLLSDKDAVAECGCTAAVYEVIEEFEDGRLNILVEGRDRFRLEALIQPDDPEADYLRGRVSLLSDDEGGGSDEAIVEAAALFERVVSLMGAESPRVPEGDAPLSFRLAAAIDFGLPLKQRVLEAGSEAERLELLITVMRALVPGLELRKEREEAIRGNGKGN
jgi:Lon protease-like protein